MTLIVDNMRSIVRRVEIVAECLLAYLKEPQTYIHRGITYPENICFVENKHDFLRQEYSIKGKNTKVANVACLSRLAKKMEQALKHVTLKKNKNSQTGNAVIIASPI